MTAPKGRVLIVAGSDSGGGAGIQGDLKTVQALGGYGMTAITALTAQNTQGVFGIHPVPEDFIAQQMMLCLEDIGADCIKTGMLHSASVIETVVASLDRFFLHSPPEGESMRHSGAAVGGEPLTSHPPTDVLGHVPLPLRGGVKGQTPQSATLPLVVDPVMVAKGGAPLLEAAALDALKALLIPRATIITPNLPEAELLLGRPIPEQAMEQAALALLALGSQAVLLKGGHGTGETLTDILVTQGGATLTLTAQRRDTRHTHGTGCAFASAIATGLAQGLSLHEATLRAHGYVQDAIARAPGFGHGNGPLGH